MGSRAFPDMLVVRDAAPAQLFPPLDSKSPKRLMAENVAGPETGGCLSCRGCSTTLSSPRTTQGFCVQDATWIPHLSVRLKVQGPGVQSGPQGSSYVNGKPFTPLDLYLRQ